MKKVLFSFAIALLAGVSWAAAQPRPVDKNADAKPTVHAAAPSTVEAKYEGGMFGYSKKVQGTIKFDDAGERLVFFDKDQKEQFTIPYSAILVVSPNTTKVQSGTGRAIGAAPILGAGLGGSLLKKKKNYMLVQFRDQDVNAQGTATFLLDTEELLVSVIKTLGEKAEMKQRGDAYYRPNSARKPDF